MSSDESSQSEYVTADDDSFTDSEMMDSEPEFTDGSGDESNDSDATVLDSEADDEFEWVGVTLDQIDPIGAKIIETVPLA